MKKEYEDLRSICRNFLTGNTSRITSSIIKPHTLASCVVELVNTVETMEKTPPPAPVVVVPLAVDAAFRFFCGLNNHIKDMSPELSREYVKHVQALGRAIKGSAWNEEQSRIQKEADALFAESEKVVADRKKRDESKVVLKDGDVIRIEEVHENGRTFSRGVLKDQLDAAGHQLKKSKRFVDGLLSSGMNPEKYSALVETGRTSINDQRSQPPRKDGLDEFLKTFAPKE